MLIRYNVTMDDIIAFNRQHFRNSPSMKRTRLALVWFFPLALVALCGTPLALQQKWLPFCLIFMVAAITHLYFRYSRGRGMDKRVLKVYKEDPNPGLLGEQKLEILDYGLSMQNAVLDAKTNWAGIVKIIPTDEACYIYTTSVSAIPIPKAGLLEGNYDEFVQALQSRYAAATVAKP